jgi:serine/threonine protein kinase/tetratricopeptide (TPR) repeat protein
VHRDEFLAWLLERLDEDPSFDVEFQLASRSDADAAWIRERLALLDAMGWARGRGDSPTPPKPPQLPEHQSFDEAYGGFDAALECDGRYRYIRTLGRGGMGAVFLVEDVRLGRQVALKTTCRAPHAQGRSLNKSLDRFRREARITARLQHPGIVPIHDIFLAPEGRLAYTMKAIEGRTLEQWISELAREPETARVKFPLARRLDVAVRIAETIAFVHDAGILHRDLKPGNVMIGRYGEVLVTDFGLACAVGEATLGDIDTRVATPPPDESPRLTTAGALLGTVRYMAPEQIRRDRGEVDERTDVFGLGALLFEWLALESVARGRDSAEERENARAGVVPGLDSLGARSLPRELLAICRKALAPEPDRRYASAEALRRDLEAFRASAPGSAWRDSLVAAIRKRIARHKVGAAICCAALLVTLVASLSLHRIGVESISRVHAERMRRAADLRAAARSLVPEPLLSGEPTLVDPTRVPHDEIHRWMEWRQASQASTIGPIARALTRFAGVEPSADASPALPDGLVDAIEDSIASGDPDSAELAIDLLLDLECELEALRIGRAARLADRVGDSLATKHDETGLARIASAVPFTLALHRAAGSAIDRLAPRIETHDATLRRAIADAADRAGLHARDEPLPAGHAAVGIPQGITTAARALRLGEYHLLAGNREAALEAFCEAARRDSRSFRANMRVAAIAGSPAGTPDRVLTLLHAARASAAFERSPRDPYLAYAIGVSLYHLGRFSEARDAFLDAAELAPAADAPWSALASVAENDDDQAQSAAALDAALRRDPANARTRARRAVVRARLRDHGGAAADYLAVRGVEGVPFELFVMYAEATSRDPGADSSTAVLALRDYFTAVGQGAAEPARAGAGRSTRAWLALAYMDANGRRLGDAVTAARCALDEEPSDSESWDALFQFTRSAEGDLVAPAVEFHRISATIPLDAPGLAARRRAADSLASGGLYLLADDLYATLWAHDPHEARWPWLRATVLARGGRAEAAIGQIEQATRLIETGLDPRMSRPLADRTKAADFLDEILSDPRHAAARSLAGDRIEKLTEFRVRFAAAEAR